MNGLSGQVTVTQQGVYVYDIEFAPERVDSIIAEFGNIEPVEFRFYPATTNLLRTAQPVEVKRKEFFRDATWEELQIGKEKTYTSSSLNKLATMRKEIDYTERQQYGGAESNTVTTNEHKTINTAKPTVKPAIESDKTTTNEVDISIRNEPPTTTTTNKKPQHRYCWQQVVFFFYFFLHLIPHSVIMMTQSQHLHTSQVFYHN